MNQCLNPYDACDKFQYYNPYNVCDRIYGVSVYIPYYLQNFFFFTHMHTPYVIIY